MNILQVLSLLQLLVGAAFSQTQTVRDYWGEFGAYGPCSRTCGTGVAMRVRKCLTSRTDGGHNCLGSSKSFLTCNTHECPAGSKDFREQQCSQFDGTDFQGQRHTWQPYYGGSNPCELNCVPLGEDFFYRHKPAVVDGTKCYVGRSEICVAGVCRVLTHGEFMGLDENVNSAQSPVLVPLAPRQRETHVYFYKAGVYGQCSVSCDGGLQRRSVECWIQDPSNPRVVEETNCITLGLQRPNSQLACNIHPCAEYSLSSFSVCSVTCGEGQQMREVVCVGPGGERLAEHACSGLVPPPSVQACHTPACHTHITWHVTAFGLCTRSCGGGVRERRVGCLDAHLKAYPESRCGSDLKPNSVETCNSQPCTEPQRVPSVQVPAAGGSTMRRFVPHVPTDPAASGPNTNTATVVHCQLSTYGCCPDGNTPAAGHRREGCPREDCVNSRFGCCLDELTAAKGFGRAGCPEYQTPVQHPSTRGAPSSDDVCSLPKDEGSCDTWKSSFYFDSATNKCSEFWFGGCQGNANNFESLTACQAQCQGVVREPVTWPGRGTPRRGSPPRSTPRP
ncbi:papilin b, proteoglycan-like sulfated glycoprotein [Gouania willdenowi]|nr:papilin-like [Gouania willdenowi]